MSQKYGRIAIVTGATSGIGEATARRLVAAGFGVAGNGRNAAKLGPRGIRVSLVEPGIALSGFQEVAGYSDGMVQNFKDSFGPLLVGNDVAEAIHYIVTRPPHVHISDMVVRPTRQDYP